MTKQLMEPKQLSINYVMKIGKQTSIYITCYRYLLANVSYTNMHACLHKKRHFKRSKRSHIEYYSHSAKIPEPMQWPAKEHDTQKMPVQDRAPILTK